MAALFAHWCKRVATILLGCILLVAYLPLLIAVAVIMAKYDLEDLEA